MVQEGEGTSWFLVNHTQNQQRDCLLQQPLWFSIPQTETRGDAEQRKDLRAVVPGESVQKKPGLEEVTVMGMCEPKAGAISSFVQGWSQALSVPQLPTMVRAG